jgi:hypothetical protein
MLGGSPGGGLCWVALFGITGWWMRCCSLLVLPGFVSSVAPFIDVLCLVGGFGARCARASVEALASGLWRRRWWLRFSAGATGRELRLC